MRIKSLKNFLTFNFLLVAILPLLLVSALSLGLMRQSLKDTIAQKNLAITKTLAGEVDLFLQEPVRILKQVRDVVAIHRGNAAAIDAYLTTVTNNYSFLDRLQIVANNGRVIHNAPANQDTLGSDMSGQDFFLADKPIDSAFWSKTFISEQTGFPTVTISLQGGNTLFVAYLNLQTLSSMAEALSRDTAGHTYITDNKGVTIAHTDQKKVLQRANVRGLVEVKAGIAGQEGSFLRPNEDDASKMELASVARVGKTSWLVLYHEDIDLAFAPLRLLNKLLFVALAFSVIVAILLALLVMNEAMDPLAQFILNAGKITEGDYSLQLPQTRFSELATLTERFASMAGAVQQREQNLQYRLQLDTLISNISTEFINIPANSLEPRIQQALADVGSFLDVDRTYIFLFDQEGKTMSCRFEWCADDITAHLHKLQHINIHRDLPWFGRMLNEKAIVHVPRVADLPEEARCEQKKWQQEEVQSLLCFPMLAGDIMIGFVGLDTVHRTKDWADDLMSYLRILAELFTNAIERERSEFILKRLQTAINQARESIAILDADGNIQYVNPAFSSMTGFSRDQVLSEPLTSFLQPADPETILTREITTALVSEENWNGHFKNKLPGGSVIDQEITISPIHLGREVNGFVFVSRDITEQLQLESLLQQSQRMESIGTLAGGIAHDFNNILSAVMGHAELAALTPNTPEKVEDHLQQILAASKRATELVRRILTFSRRSGQRETTLQMRPIIEESLKLLRSSLPTTIAIRQDIEEDAPIQADPTQMHQIVMNLCTNAFQAMQQKGGLLTVSLYKQTLSSSELEHLSPELKPGDYVILSIADTGPGIPADIAAHIFEPYFTTKKKEKGTGLGLAVVHGIVTQAGGTIQLESQPDTETIFRLYFPVAKGEQRQIETQPDTEPPTGAGHILIVDDEEMLVGLEREILLDLGYTVTAETDSLAALQRFLSQAEEFDLILTDLTMPGMTGIELAGQIRQTRPDIPIIMCTGYSKAVSEGTLKDQGIVALLPKPFSRLQLARVVAEALA